MPTKKHSNTSHKQQNIVITFLSKFFVTLGLDLIKAKEHGIGEVKESTIYYSRNTNWVTVKVLLFVRYQFSWFSLVGQWPRNFVPDEKGIPLYVYPENLKTTNSRIHELKFLPKSTKWVSTNKRTFTVGTFRSLYAWLRLTLEKITV